MGQIVGGIIAVYLLSLLFNFIIRKIKKNDTMKQRVIATTIAVLCAITVWFLTTMSMNDSVDDVLGGILCYIVGGKSPARMNSRRVMQPLMAQ